MTPFATRKDRAEGRSTGQSRLTTTQWVVLIMMAGVLLSILAALVLVLRAVGLNPSVDARATAVARPTLSPASSALVPDAVTPSARVYRPPDPQPLATPNAPSDLLWWDGRFAYRCPVLLDQISAELPAGTWASLIFDGEGAQRAGKMRADGADLRVVVWDGTHWWEIPRRAQARLEKRGWDVVFSLQGAAIAQSGSYYLYYGNPLAEEPPAEEEAPATSRLLLSTGEEEGVEWGPEVLWMANSQADQTLVSPDGRVVIRCPAGGPRVDVRVRLRTVPLGERNNNGPLPDFELHADPPPSPEDMSNIARWDPPLTVTTNWAGLEVDERFLATRVHFIYDTERATWYSVPIVFDREKGLTRLTTDQP